MKIRRKPSQAEGKLKLPDSSRIPLENPEFAQSLTDLSESLKEFLIEDEAEGSSGLPLENLKRQNEQRKLKRKSYDDWEVKALFVARLTYAAVILALCIKWMYYISDFIVQCGLGNYKVSDAVQIAVITTTTANVLGVYIIVANWLFPRATPEGKEKEDKNQ